LTSCRITYVAPTGDLIGAFCTHFLFRTAPNAKQIFFTDSKTELWVFSPSSAIRGLTLTRTISQLYSVDLSNTTKPDSFGTEIMGICFRELFEEIDLIKLLFILRGLIAKTTLRCSSDFVHVQRFCIIHCSVSLLYDFLLPIRPEL